MKHQKHASILSILLTAVLILTSPVTNVFAKETEAATPANSDAKLSAQMVRQSNRASGLVGFEEAYALENPDEPISVIVEFVHQPASLVEAIAAASGETPSADYETLDTLAQQDRTDFYAALEGVDYSVTYEYDIAMNGLSITLPQSSVENIASLDCVFAVYPNETYENVTMPDDLPDINGDGLPAAYSVGDDFIEGMADSREYLDIDELGLTGAGVTVGVIDTGIDYNHPDLQDTFSTILPNGETPSSDELLNGKFIGRNYIDNGNAANDPMDDHGHGTHVSGTIGARAANTSGISAKGLAPDSTLVSYKAINSSNSCQLDDIIAAMSDAVNDGCEIISMSLGWSTATDATHGTNLALNSLALQHPDVLFVVCAGNNGSDSYTLWSPGTSPLALTVANARIPSANRLLTLNRDGAESKLRLIRSDWEDSIAEQDGKFIIEHALTPDETGNYKMVFLPTTDGTGLGTGTEEEFNAFITEENAALYEGALFVLKRGESFDSTVPRMLNAVGKGAILVLNTEDRQDDFEGISWWQGYFNHYAPVFTLDHIAAQSFSEGLVPGESYPFSFTYAEGLHSSASADIGCYPAADTSIGPVSKTYDLKPDLAAPGTAVVSTVYKNYNGESDNYELAYATMNGTSMATPHVSAIAALLKEKNTNLTALDIKSLLVNTANPSAFDKQISRLAVGAGMINPAAAIRQMDDLVTVTAKNSHAFSNVAEFDPTVQTPTISMDWIAKGEQTARETEIVVTNKSNVSHNYTISLENTTHTSENQSTSASPADGVFSLSTNTISVPAGSSEAFTLTANVSADAPIGSYETTVTLTEGDTQLISPAMVYVYELIPIQDEPINHEYTFIHNAVLSSGEHKQLENYDMYGSDRTLFHFRFADPTLNTWQPLLYSETGEFLGIIDMPYQDSWDEWDWYYYNTIGSWYAPCTMDESGNITQVGDYGPIPEGNYKLGLQLTKTDVPSKNVMIADLFIDNTLPELSIASENSWNGKKDGENIIFSGTIYDKGTETMQSLGINSTINERIFGITTSQKDNVLVVRIGETDYRANIQEDGSFTVTVPESELNKTATVYYGDHFLPQGSEGRSDMFCDGFDPEQLSYTVQLNELHPSVPFMGCFGYRAANMDQFKIKLTLEEEKPEDPVTPTDPEDPKDPSDPQKPGETDTPGSDHADKPNSDKPSSNDKNHSQEDPIGTGDNSALTFYMAIFTASLCGIILCLLYMNRKRQHK